MEWFLLSINYKKEQPVAVLEQIKFQQWTFDLHVRVIPDHCIDVQFFQIFPGFFPVHDDRSSFMDVPGLTGRSGYDGIIVPIVFLLVNACHEEQGIIVMNEISVFLFVPLIEAGGRDQTVFERAPGQAVYLL